MNHHPIAGGGRMWHCSRACKPRDTPSHAIRRWRDFLKSSNSASSVPAYSRVRASLNRAWRRTSRIKASVIKHEEKETKQEREKEHKDFKHPSSCETRLLTRRKSGLCLSTQKLPQCSKQHIFFSSFPPRSTDPYLFLGGLSRGAVDGHRRRGDASTIDPRDVTWWLLLTSLLDWVLHVEDASAPYAHVMYSNEKKVPITLNQ
jgi:hypothetical protein